MSTQKSVGIVSLGCPKAASDAEQIITRLRAEGYKISGSYEGADLVLVNTCGFIDAAVEESLSAIGEALAENGKVIVTGCLGAKKDADGDDIVLKNYPNVLAVTGPHATQEVMDAVHAHLPPAHDPHMDLVPPQGVRLTPDHYAYLKISEGCNHACSFCIIPSLRGALESRPVGEVLREAETLVDAGVRELLIISQDTSAYGLDLKYRTGFWNGRPVKTRLYELCRELGQMDIWVRLHYVYPYPSVDDLLPLMAEGKLLPYLDIPFQHANSRLLKSMKRPASAEKVLERIASWRKLVPDLTLRSTFITGFPGETEAEFNELLDFLDEAQLDRVGAFAYSPVSGAAANELPGALPEEVREERKARLLRHQEDISTQRLERKIGRRIVVLVDDIDEDGAIARSEGDAPDVDGLVLIADGHELPIGEFVEVEVTDCDVHDLYAELC
ncbi:MAG TPA: 30S ribosomal protein S12 methylthiotransferase RimO [Rhodocyclaceae bacterium]|nr:30S ribosomal protein S12 methylthiotransferase RimO [Rhodocyclaceae bacterium]